MLKNSRRHVSRDVGSYHIISRVVGGRFLLKKKEKNFFYKLLRRLAACYFVEIREFIIMSNHFHLLAKENKQAAEEATFKELEDRYQKGFGESSDPPIGSKVGNELIPDADGGEDRLRRRLGSISDFVKDLKQMFSWWYNQKHNLQGHFWDGRFKGIIVYNGAPELAVSAYINANAVRAGIVERAEDYEWCSLAERIQNPDEAEQWLFPVTRQDVINNPKDDEPIPFLQTADIISEIEWYRIFVSLSVGKEVNEINQKINVQEMERMIAFASDMGIMAKFRKRIRNFTEGIVVGTPKRVEALQEREEKVHVKARNFLGTYWSYATRVMRD